MRRQLLASDTDLVTITTLRGACVTLAKGSNGVQYGARPVPIDDDALPNVEAAAIDWFRAVTEVIGPAIENREQKLASARSVFAAIGAVGNQIVAITDPDERKVRARQLAASLSDVNWERGKKWEGIAGSVWNALQRLPEALGAPSEIIPRTP